jgi:hypothetical protein
MVTVAREEARAAGVAADVWVADAQDPGSGLGPDHVVTASLVLFFLPDPASALRAWRRLVVSAGRIGVTTFAGHPESWRVDEVFVPYLPPGMGTSAPSGVRVPSPRTRAFLNCWSRPASPRCGRSPKASATPPSPIG